jgi:serine/threonine protein kinase
MQMDGGGFLGSGGYGCVFYPEVSCKGKDTKNTNFLSKIVEKDYSSDNEIALGKILKQRMKKWVENPLENHFAPVISHCNIKIGELDIEEKEKCEMMMTENNDDYVMMKIKHISGTEFDNIIVQNTNNALIMLMFTSSYTHLLKSLQMLKHAKICHFDIKAANIVYDDVKSLPIIIDFGLSIDMKNLNMKELYNSFYIFDTIYYIWPLEVHLINYILHQNDTLSESGMREIAKDYVKNNVVLRAFSPEFNKKYEDECYYELSKYIGKDSDAVIERIIKYWDTWDNYALSLLYIKLLYYLIRNNEGVLIKNKFISFFIELCLKNIHPNPKKRLSVEETLRSFNLFLYNQQIDKETLFEDIMEQINENKLSIDKVIIKDKRHMTLMSIKTRGARRKLVRRV